MGSSPADDMFGSQDETDSRVLQDADRFHCILRSDEIVLADSTISLLIVGAGEWWACQDSNLGPRDYESPALTS